MLVSVSHVEMKQDGVSGKLAYVVRTSVDLCLLN